MPFPFVTTLQEREKKSIGKGEKKNKSKISAIYTMKPIKVRLQNS